METLFKADIFFFITSIAIVVLGSFLIVLFIYIIGILRDVKDISHRAKRESELIAEDIAEFRTTVRQQGANIKHIVNFLKKIGGRTSKNKKKVTST